MRRRSVWLAAAFAVALLAAFLVTRRRATPAVAAAPVVPPASAPKAPEQPSTPDGHVFFEESASVPESAPIEAEPLTEETGHPLPTWVRAAVVAGALLAFFAVSLLATKRI
ncbi:MAG: hypothetical protein JJD92_12005 [Frankiaceae bacterium]|nr:hypothetical protein [Frankiaceae bacterium]